MVLSAARRDGASGDAVAAWERYDVGSSTVVESASRPANGNWDVPIDLAAGQYAALAQVAMSADGDAVAVWTRVLEYENLVETAARPAGGQWGPPTGLPGAAAQSYSYSPQVAMDAGGDAVAVWTHNDSSSLSVQAAEYSIAGNTSSAPGTAGAPARPPAAGKLTPAPRVHLLYTPNRPHKPHPAGGPRWTFHFSDQTPKRASTADSTARGSGPVPHRWSTGTSPAAVTCSE